MLSRSGQWPPRGGIGATAGIRGPVAQGDLSCHAQPARRGYCPFRLFPRSPTTCEVSMPGHPNRSFTRPAALLALVACLLLAACGGKQPEMAASPIDDPVVEKPLLDYLSTHDGGSSATLDDPEFGKSIRVFVEGSFLSASGQECRRATLLTRDGQAEVVVACKGDDGTWTMAPRIWGQGIGQ